MIGDPTITVPTLDHGDVTIPEPSWCTGITHQAAVHRSDICHQGPDIEITVGAEFGPRELLTLFLAQHPFAEPKASWAPGTRVYVAAHLADGDHHSYDVAGLMRLADDVEDAARRVRLVARRLSRESATGGGR